MGSDQDLALLFEISADPAQAQQALASLGSSASTSMDSVVAATKPFNESLLNQHQSVHLLAEEMGVHLPRAVVSGISEMLPNISQLGGALLGVFAVKEIYEFEKGLNALYADFDNVAQGEKEMAKYARENEAALDGMARASIEVARTQLHQLQMQAAVAASAANKIQDQKDLLEAYFGAMGAGVSKISGVTKEYNAAQAEANRLQDLAVKMAAIFGEDAEKAHEKSARAADKELAAFAKLQAAADPYYSTIYRTGQQLGYYAVAIDGMTKSVDVDVVSLRLWETMMERTAQILPLVQQHIKGLVTPIDQVNYAVTTQISNLKLLVRAMDSSTAATVEGAAQMAAGMIGGRRAAAIVEGAWDVAKGAEQIAMALDPYDPAHAEHIASAAQYFVSAAAMGVIAGSGGGGGSKSGGGGGGGSSSGYSGSPGGSGGGGGGAATPGSGTTIHMHIQGMVSVDTMQQFFNQANSLVKGGQLVISATNALYNGEKLG